MIELGRLLAIVACLGSALFAFGVAPTSAQAPSLGLSSDIVTEGSVTAFGSHFCAAPTCSTVTITVDGRLAAADVPVAADGTFEIPVAITKTAGNYTVTASQVATDGSPLTASAGLVVPAQDFAEPTIVPPTTAPPQPSPPEQEPTPTGASPSSTSSATAAPTRDGDLGQPTPTPTLSPAADAADVDGAASQWVWVVVGVLAALSVTGLGAALLWFRRTNTP